MYYKNINGVQAYYDGTTNVTETANGFYFAKQTDKFKVQNYTGSGIYHPVWANGTTGYVDPYVTSPKLQYIPSTGTLISNEFKLDSSVTGLTLKYNSTLKSLDFVFD